MILNRAKELLEERKLKIMHLAAAEGALTDIPRNTLSAIVNNSTNGIDYRNLESMCRVLNVTPNEFFHFDPPLPAMQNTVEALSERHKALLVVLSAYCNLAQIIEYGAIAIADRLEESISGADVEDRQQAQDTVLAVRAYVDEINRSA